MTPWYQRKKGPLSLNLPGLSGCMSKGAFTAKVAHSKTALLNSRGLRDKKKKDSPVLIWKLQQTGGSQPQSKLRPLLMLTAVQ